MKWMEFPIGATAVPLEVSLNDAIGGVVGDTPSIQIRRISDGFFLDFNDQHFKASGHVQPTQLLTSAGDGRYNYKWNSSIAVTGVTTVAIEYNNVDGLAPGVDTDHITFSNSATILERLSHTPLGSVGDGTGSCKFLYKLTVNNSTTAIADAVIYVTTDIDGTAIVAGPKSTDSQGKALFYLNKNVQYYFWRTKGGYTFTNPDPQKF